MEIVTVCFEGGISDILIPDYQSRADAGEDPVTGPVVEAGDPPTAGKTGVVFCLDAPSAPIGGNYPESFVAPT